MPNATVARVAQARALLLGPSTYKEIHRKTGVSVTTLRLAAASMIASGAQLPDRSCTVDRATHEQIDKLLKTTDLSNRAIAERLGVSAFTVNTHRRRHNALLSAAGQALPQCACGLELHHPRRCRARNLARINRDGWVSVFLLPDGVQATLRERLLAGETVNRVAADYGLRRHNILAYIVKFAPEEREARGLAIRASRKPRKQRGGKFRPNLPNATDPRNDTLWAEIATLVGFHCSPHFRHDVISETYTDVLEGLTSRRGLAEGIKRAKKRVNAQNGLQWFMSLDAPDMFGRPYIDRLEAPLVDLHDDLDEW